MKYLFAIFLFSNIVIAQQQQNISHFKTLQDDLANQDWNLAINGIFLTDDIALTARQFEFVNAEVGLIEVPLLLKVKLSDKLSLLSGVKLDFYRMQQGISADVGVSASTGLQYDVNRNTYIQGVFSYQINNTGSVYNYNYGNKSSFMLRSGFKF
ncbi:hypothetical protein [uncultured Winogradskyella sp.]|uniref:hypothetical protein n=1 Tax=uncultured Winogradskyella sp. TaxID=395353 RepID=UPI00260BFC03|nr:hypothetical protein [uncultured Winogradskyella sp.]